MKDVNLTGLSDRGSGARMGTRKDEESKFQRSVSQTGLVKG